MPFGAFAPLPLRLGGNETEGLTAAQHARLCADLVSAKRSAPLAVISYSTSGDVLHLRHYVGQNSTSVSGSGVSGSCAANSDSRTVTIALPASITDDYGIESAATIKHALVTESEYVTGSAVAASLGATTSGNSVVVYTYFGDYSATLAVW